MSEGFDKDYWESHWQRASGIDARQGFDANPYLAQETRDLARGTALDDWTPGAARVPKRSGSPVRAGK